MSNISFPFILEHLLIEKKTSDVYIFYLKHSSYVRELISTVSFEDTGEEVVSFITLHNSSSLSFNIVEEMLNTIKKDLRNYWIYNFLKRRICATCKHLEYYQKYIPAEYDYEIICSCNKGAFDIPCCNINDYYSNDAFTHPFCKFRNRG